MKIQYFEKTNPVNWYWPVQIGLLPPEKTTDLLNQIRAQDEAAHLAHTYFLSRARSHCNILLWKGDVKSFNRTLTQLDWAIEADMVCFFCTTNDWAKLKAEDIIAVTKAIAANGIAFIPSPDNVAVWLNALIIELSHNHTIRQAIEVLVSDGVFCLTTALEKASKLSIHAERLRANNQFLSLDEKVAIDQELDRIINVGDFNQESNDASKIVELSNSIAAEIYCQNTNEGYQEKSSKRGFGEAEARYLQCKIQDQEEEIRVVRHLKNNTAYTLDVRIGPSHKNWLQTSKAAPVDALFTEAGQTESLQISFISNQSAEIQEKYIQLPAKGRSTAASFDFKIDTKEEEWQGEIYLYHKNRLLQGLIISAYVLKTDTNAASLPHIRIQNLSIPRLQLDHLSESSAFGLSLQQSGNQLLANTGKIASFPLQEGINEWLNKIRGYIEEAALDTDEYPLDLMHENNANLLMRLALRGNDIYTNYFKDLEIGDKPIQIVTSKSDFIPLEFVYTAAPPKEEAQLCTNAKIALKEGKCAACFDKTKAPADHICPFGFLCFSHVIERHNIGQKTGTRKDGDVAFYSDSSTTRKELTLLKSTLFAASHRVDKGRAGLIDEIHERIKSSSTQSSFAKNWKEWEQAVSANLPDCLVLVAHTEISAESDSLQLEIGEEEFLLKNYIRPELIDPVRTDPAPIVILIGCRTQDLKMPVFALSNQFKNQGAALVLSNFTKIRGSQAGPIVIKLFDFFEQKRGQTFTFGEIMLKLRQYLLSEGLLVSLALTAQGDADWKIKI